MKILSLSLLLVFTILISCTKPPDYPIEPVIEFSSLSQTFMSQGEPPTDSLYMTFSFTDGDGDLGSQGDSLDVFLSDTRFGLFNITFRLPFVPEQGAGNGISGEITIGLPGTCCIFPNNVSEPCGINPEFPTNALFYEVYIRDRAGNESNRIISEEITLLCD